MIYFLISKLGSVPRENKINIEFDIKDLINWTRKQENPLYHMSRWKYSFLLNLTFKK